MMVIRIVTALPDRMPPFRSLHLFLLFTVVSVACAAKTCNVLDFDGVADNMTDIAPAVTKAYTECVSNATTSNPDDTILLVPAGTYALETQVNFVKGQNFSVEINGDLHLKFNSSLGGNMFLFHRCNHGKLAMGHFGHCTWNKHADDVNFESCGREMVRSMGMVIYGDRIASEFASVVIHKGMVDDLLLLRCLQCITAWPNT